MTPNPNEETGLDATHPRRRGARSEGYLEGERRLATILFCDVQGSTSMAEQLDPEEWAEIMEEAFDSLIAPVVRYGGTVARLMGDGILAVFGAPIAHEDDPRRAILTALDIFDSIRPFKEEFQRSYRMDFELRTGINTGMVVVGEIGSDLAAEWTAMGDAVNLAARMEQTAAPGTIQVSEDTYRLVAPLFDFEPLGEITVKGKRNTVWGYRVLEEKKRPGRLRGIPGLNTPLIGRLKELDVIRQAFDQLLEGRGGVVCLIGEAGLGKSRMVEEMYSTWTGAMEQQGGWVEGRCVSFEASRPYGLFRQYLYQFCGVEKNDPPELAREKILCTVVARDGRTGSAQAEKLRAVEVLLGETIEALYADRLEDQAHLLAMHFNKALEREKALKYYTLAGDLARRLYANMYRELEAAGEARQDSHMQLAALIRQATLRSIPSAVFDQATGRELSKRALELSRQLGDHSAEARSLWNMMLMEIMGGGNLRKAIAFGEKSLAISVQYDLIEEQAYALHDLSRAYIYAGRFQDAAPALTRAKKLWRELGNRTLLADSLGTEASSYIAQGQFERAVQAAGEGLIVAQAIDNPWGVAYNQLMLGLAYFETGEIARGIHAFEEANTLGKESEFNSAQVTAATITGWIYGILGDPRRGLQKIRELSQQQEIVTPSMSMLDAGEVYLHLMNGDLDQANWTAAALKERVNMDELEVFFSPFAHAIFGELALANGDPEGALDYVEKVLVPMQQHSQMQYGYDLNSVKGKALLRIGKRPEGLLVLENACRAAEAAGARRAVWMALQILVEIYRQEGDVKRAEAARAQVLDLAKFFFRQIEDQALREKFLEKYQLAGYASRWADADRTVQP